ncbi:MAG: VOC family protein [Gammaproteobacteria bacterium]|nr:VOC family protein [Gammaproteobacteria bacterium]MDE2261077.1 VOC family protein [Gammaproteobacteria bacterium]
MSNAEIRGRFVWHELMTTDPQAAATFYSRVLPWKTQPSGMPDYTLWVSGKTMTAGLMAQPESARQAGAPPSWLVYIGTADVDGTAAAAERLGGKVLKAPADIPAVGRFAVLADPQGAAFAIFTPSAMPGDAAPPTDFSWHELATSDQQGAIAFYSELFGWARGPAHDMGPAGTYQLIEHGGAQVGGIYKVMDASKPPHWLTYIEVASVDKAAAAAKAAGGRVTQGPMEVPGGSRIAQILDPQGGAFAVHELARQSAAAGKPAEKSSAAKPAPAKSRPAARKRPAKPASAAKAPARPARKAAAKAKKRPAAAKHAATKSAAGKSPARKSPARKAAGKRPAARKASKTTGKKSGKRSAAKSARRR